MRTTLFSSLVLMLLLLASSSVYAGEFRLGSLRISFEGNRVLVDEIYLAVLQFSRDSKASDKLARRVERRLTEFLHESGYELATVSCAAEDNHLRVKIEEGQVEKIVFVGKGSIRTVQLKLDLSLPGRVFNRPHLERQLDDFSRRYGIGEIRYGLVETKLGNSSEFQIDDWNKWTGEIALFPKSARYDLVIYLGASSWGSGLGLGLNYRSSDGATLDVRYRGSGLLLNDDRWEIGGELGGKLRTRLDSDEVYPALTVGDIGWRWFTPDLWNTGIRPSVELDSELTSRQRVDLDLETYFSQRLMLGGAIQYEWADRMSLSLGGGVESRWLFALDQLDTATTELETRDEWRPYVKGQVSVVFNRGELRRDRLHSLRIEGRRYWWNDGETMDRLELDYGITLPLGWNELRFQVRGEWVRGFATFDEDAAVHGDHVRAVFVNQYFVHQVGSLSVEFRWSLVRDQLMLGFYHDLAVFGENVRDPGEADIRVANSFGPGLHILLLDTFQFDMFYGVGFSSDDEFDHGLVLNLSKVF